MPPISLSLNCFAISIVASLLTLKTVSSIVLFPVYFPVLTSIAVNASVLSIVINPPHFSQIFLLFILLICCSKSYMSKMDSSLFTTIGKFLYSGFSLFILLISL